MLKVKGNGLGGIQCLTAADTHYYVGMSLLSQGGKPLDLGFTALVVEFFQLVTDVILLKTRQGFILKPAENKLIGKSCTYSCICDNKPLPIMNFLGDVTVRGTAVLIWPPLHSDSDPCSKRLYHSQDLKLWRNCLVFVVLVAIKTGFWFEWLIE